MQKHLTEGTPFRQLLLLLFPLLLCSFIQQAYGVGSNVIISRQLGTDAVAVINGSAANLINIFYNVANGLSVGAMIAAARLSGEKNPSGLRRCMKSALGLHMVFSLFITLLYWFFGKSLLSFLLVPEGLLADSVSYIKLYSLGFPFYSLAMLVIAIQRGKGDLKQPTVELLWVCLLNILMDWLFVRTLDLGIRGAALSFTVTYFLSAVYLTGYLHKHYGILSRRTALSLPHIRLILYIGIPACLASMFYDGANTYTQTAVNRLGSTAIAAAGLSFKIENFFYMVMQAMATAAVTLLAASDGAGRRDRFKSILTAAFAICYGLAVFMGLITFLGRGILPQMFTKDESVIEMCRQILAFIAPLYLLYPVLEILLALTRSMKKVVVPTVITLAACLGRIVWISRLPQGYSILEAKFSYPLSWIITSSLMLFYCLVLYRFSKGKTGSHSGP